MSLACGGTFCKTLCVGLFAKSVILKGNKPITLDIQFSVQKQRRGKPETDIKFDG